ncbi:hypothetical protein FH972_026447 [Carpinus fangiana]|uniref:Uncharacterized protein n=1 Tax=Carpinus fangiana TaxID=176857 RepID=A0A5N6L409_9ROSI|nr:hypothetical protein FH972_026447 [Carpinus fangiana]
MGARWIRWTSPLPRTSYPEKRFVQILASAAVFIVVCLALVSFSPGQGAGYAPFHSASVGEPRRLHFLLPSDKSDARICKAMFSALVNGYPSPILLNWGLEESSLEMNGYDMKAGKIWGVLQYLRALPRSADDDLVLMSDAYDVWFQLPPDILLARYDAANARANARIAREHGEVAVAAHNLAQTIIFGAEKFCWPRNHTDPACYAVPMSTLRPDAYGPHTDSAEVKTQRPRFLNSGLIAGPVSDMRALYERVHELWTAEAPVTHSDDEKANDGDQNIFAEVYGRQEYARQRIRGTNDWVFNFGESHANSTLAHPSPDDRSWEFHIGLDLDGNMFQALNEAHMDLSFVTHADSAQLAKFDRKHGTDTIYGPTDASFPFPADLELLERKPFDALVGEDTETSALRRKGWADVPLATNFHARTIPVALHHNGYNRLLKPWWREVWWTVFGAGSRLLRDMRNQRTQLGAWTVKGVFLSWDELCEGFDRDVFPP